MSPDAYLCHVGSSVAGTLGRAPKLGASPFIFSPSFFSSFPLQRGARRRCRRPLWRRQPQPPPSAPSAAFFLKGARTAVRSSSRAATFSSQREKDDSESDEEEEQGHEEDEEDEEEEEHDLPDYDELGSSQLSGAPPATQPSQRPTRTRRPPPRHTPGTDALRKRCLLTPRYNYFDARSRVPATLDPTWQSPPVIPGQLRPQNLESLTIIIIQEFELTIISITLAAGAREISPNVATLTTESDEREQCIETCPTCAIEKPPCWLPAPRARNNAAKELNPRFVSTRQQGIDVASQAKEATQPKKPTQPPHHCRQPASTLMASSVITRLQPTRQKPLLFFSKNRKQLLFPGPGSTPRPRPFQMLPSSFHGSVPAVQLPLAPQREADTSRGHVSRSPQGRSLSIKARHEALSQTPSDHLLHLPLLPLRHRPPFSFQLLHACF
nr:unnamed protein product [Digitaria exilis]